MRSKQTTRIWNISWKHKSWTEDKQDKHYVCQDLTLPWNMSVKIVDGGLHFLFFIFLFSLYFIFFFFFFFSFLFLEQLRLGFICHTVTSVTSWWRSHKTDHGTWKNGVEGSGIKWRHTTWTTCVGLMSYTWSFRVGCTVVSTDHE